MACSLPPVSLNLQTDPLRLKDLVKLWTFYNIVAFMTVLPAEIS